MDDRQRRNKLFPDCRGSVMVEVALIVPAIVFLLLAGVMLVHVVQLTRATDRAAALLADEFAQETPLTEEAFDAAITATADIVASGGFPVDLWLSIKAFEIGPSGGTTIWSRTRAAGGTNCTTADAALNAPEGVVAGAGSIYLVQADICATPTAGFFLSSILEVAGYTLQARAVSVGRLPAVRSLQ